MPRPMKPSPEKLYVPQSARFLRLARPLKKKDVRDIFSKVIKRSGARRTICREERVLCKFDGSEFVRSFLCFETNPPIKFMSESTLSERRYGFVLLIERRMHLAIFHQMASGLDAAVRNLTEPVDRHVLTHIWADKARYHRFGTKRMSISRQELRGASFAAYDLETAFIPALAGRSIVQSMGLFTRDYGNVAVTPSTGRIRVQSTRVSFEEILKFVDFTIDAFEARTRSAFLSAFPTPIAVSALPQDVTPTGLLFDFGQLDELLRSDAVSLAAPESGSVRSVLEQLDEVLILRPDGEQWEAFRETGERVARLKRLKHSFSVYCEALGQVIVGEQDGEKPLDRWIRDHDAFSVSFSSPDYFYAQGILVRTEGFNQEVELVRSFLKGDTALTKSKSEKGDTSDYDESTRRFPQTSIFRILEDSLVPRDNYLLCCDLGDEWADYIGVGSDQVTFYHCKHGNETAGAAAFHIITAQALKNLSRIKFRPEEIKAKVRAAQDRKYWGKTRIPLLARPDVDWQQLEQALLALIERPTTRWCVAIVVDALSVARFDAEAARSPIRPHFIQLVWLLSAFISSCRERDAEPLIICRP